MKYLFIFLIYPVVSISASDKLLTILKKTDALYRSSSSYAEIEMQVKSKHWERTMSMQMWTKGMKKTLVRVLAPKKDAGISTLKRDEDLWNYFPKINKVIKIPPSMMMGSWMGSDFTNDDMVKEATLIDDYSSRFIKGVDQRFFYIELKPKESTVTVWGKIVLKVRKDDEILLEQQFYNEKDELIRIMELSEIKNMDGKMIPTKIVLTPVKRAEQFTVVKYLKIMFNKGIKDSVFTRKNLQKIR